MRVLQYSPKTLVKVPNVFGSGADGDLVYSSNTTLTGDVNARTIVINSGVSLDTAGYRLFASVRITNSGTIMNNGTNGGARSITIGGAGATAGTLPGGCDGAPVNAIFGAADKTSFFSHGCGDGNYGGHTAGVFGTNPSAAGTSYGTSTITLNVVQALSIDQGEYDTNSLHKGAAGGGGGGAENGFGGGGVGGGGGGVILLSAPIIINTAGIISAHGGNGANATNPGGANIAGGGGGGGGGLIILIGDVVSQGTTDVTGGNGGSSFNCTTSSLNGTAGTVLVVRSQ